MNESANILIIKIKNINTELFLYFSCERAHFYKFIYTYIKIKKNTVYCNKKKRKLLMIIFEQVNYENEDDKIIKIKHKLRDENENERIQRY